MADAGTRLCVGIVGTSTIGRIRVNLGAEETVVRAERRLFAHNDTPPDYKFFMFGGTVGSVAIITGRKTPKGLLLRRIGRFSLGLG